MNNPKEFAQKVSGLVLDQIERDRHVNRESIAMLVEREIGAYAPPGADKDGVINAAIALRLALQNMPAHTPWTKDVLDGYTLLSAALRFEGALR